MVEEKRRKRKEEYEKKKQEREKAGITQAEPLTVEKIGEESEPEKKTRKRKSKKKEAINSDDLNAIFSPIISIISSKPNCEHWKMTEKELKSVTEPLAEILNKNDVFGGLKNTSEITLLIALMSLIFPRTIITVQKKREVKKVGKGNATGSTGRKLDETRKSKSAISEDRKSGKDVGKNVGKSASNSETNGSILDSIGIPIA